MFKKSKNSNKQTKKKKKVSLANGKKRLSGKELC